MIASVPFPLVTCPTTGLPNKEHLPHADKNKPDLEEVIEFQAS